MIALTFQYLESRKAAFERAAMLFGASVIRVFGSVARGTATDDSDVDVLVKMELGLSLLDLIGFEHMLAEELGVRIDAVTENSLHPMLRSTILAEARAL